VGRPLPGVEVRIDDTGEILVRSGGVTRGYFKDAIGSAVALEDHWLHTGDRGVVDADGYLFVTGRIKEAMVTTAGETLYPEDVEPHYASSLFAEHCVVPVAGSDGNDVPLLVVVPSRPETSDEEIARVFAALRSAAPARCRVRAVIRRDSALPRSPLGKLRRRALSEDLRWQPVAVSR
jgi:long-chain acyl-CoA synthetase